MSLRSVLKRWFELIGEADFWRRVAFSSLRIAEGLAWGMLAGALLGASEVLGVEIDPDAVAIAGENIALNHVERIASAQYGDLTKGIDFQADVIVANLMADLVVTLSKDVARHLLPGGRYISSGILVEKMPEVVDAMRALGFAIMEVKEDACGARLWPSVRRGI